MALIDRLLQRMRIVTKVLFFVVPLIVLIAGIGLFGYFTAGTLNGQMTLTRQTIDTLSSFQQLRSALTAFTDLPSAATRDRLIASISDQQKGAATLDAMLIDPAQKQQIAAVRELGAKMQGGADALWAVSQERVSTEQAVDDAVAGLFKESQTARKQLDVLQDQANGKEAFVRALLLDASAYKNLAGRIAKLRKATAAAADPQKLGQAIGSLLPPLVKEVADSGALASDKAQSQIAALKPVLDKLAPMAKDSNLTLEAYAAVDQDLQGLQEQFAKLASGNADTAIERFTGMDASISTLRSMVAIVNAAFKSIDDLRLHLSELNRRVDAASRDAVLADLKALRDSAAKLVPLSGKNAALQDLAKKIEPSLATIEKDTSLLISIADRWRADKEAATALVADASHTLEQFVSTAQESGREISQRSATMSLAAMIAGTVLAIIGGLMLIETLRGPLKRITQTMMRLADGDLNVPIGDGKRGDEIGDMIRSVTVFRDQALEKTRLEEVAETNRARDEREQSRRAAEQARIEAEQSEALNALSDMLGKLANGNLAAEMSEDLAADYVAMARTYNHAIDALRLTLAEVRNSTYEIAEGSTNLSGAADDLARRTEQQAAALEESSRVLGELTDSVRTTAENARQTSLSVAEAHRQAEHSAAVVAKAVDAMGAINRSSEKVTSIIGVIDEIAFQTNLLALNAGVEAARAGEAGRGFAVVAQEVRELAQRCAKAAREIKDLISNSASQVGAGVTLVEETGHALSAIMKHFTSINGLVQVISASTTTQYKGIDEVNNAVRDVEHITQHNAAMVEENTAEIHRLRQQVELLNERISHFQTVAADGRRASFASSPRMSVAS
ncbi:methyl-accepting chemotaxis protein [Rhizobium leguminosarum bv. trifolii]|uniref:Methyl-accepting chemotaxis protein n=1 Tax=Rhizobium leguminosarum bv. trifolii TaxID=386 RepID=A0A3E1B1C5_RHILT|nr:methyl-accepting chemotaxis protein [Rhizobium leguminosarum]RFB83448.1 methyl-accepting chemotaxis protein [Rhizobium leguminosarum bv. trifolii]RFB84011.1 methyl-accepting chemotaxis protein [Rhizobium leguminosarum bv. trifolii]